MYPTFATKTWNKCFETVWFTRNKIVATDGWHLGSFSCNFFLMIGILSICLGSQNNNASRNPKYCLDMEKYKFSFWLWLVCHPVSFSSLSWYLPYFSEHLVNWFHRVCFSVLWCIMPIMNFSTGVALGFMSVLFLYMESNPPTVIGIASIWISVYEKYSVYWYHINCRVCIL